MIPARRTRAGRLLVVDDEARMRELVSATLGEAGYEVTGAASYEAAVDAAPSMPVPSEVAPSRSTASPRTRDRAR